MLLEFPYLLGLIFLFIACAYFCKQRQESLLFPHMRLFGSASLSASIVLKFLKWLGIVTLVIAISSPYSEREIDLEPREGYDIVLLLDASQSMNAMGFDEQKRERNRFEVVQGIVNDFIQQRSGDNLGMIVFGSYSFVASPITYDKHILSKLLSQLHIGVAGRNTAIYDAIAQSVTLMQENEAKSKIAILLTDGHNTAGSIPYDTAIALAQREGMKIYTIGIGLPGEFSEQTLAGIANETGGQYYAAYSAEQLQSIYAEINRLEKSELKGETYLHKNYFYTYFLFVSLMSLLMYLLIRSKKEWA